MSIGPAPSRQGGTHGALRIQAFGAFRVWRDGVEVGVAPVNQTILGALVAAGGGAVTVTDLVDLVWADHPPASAVNLVHRSVGQIRRALEPELAVREVGSWLMAAPGGYRFALSSADCDAAEHDRLTEEARLATPEVRADLLARAAALARHAPFTGSSEALRALPTVVALERRRAVCAADAVHAAIAVGRNLDEVLADAERVAADHPLDEHLHAAVLVGLGASGRRAEGLARFQQLRTRLRDELGLEPGADLQTAHRGLLTDVPSPGSDTRRPVARTAPRPRQLPPDVAGFCDRASESGVLTELRNRLADPQDLGGSVALVTVSGMAGVGKTTLAVHWARLLAPLYPDGQLYLNLRGFERERQSLRPGDGLRALLRSFDLAVNVDGADEVEARSARFRSEVADKRILVLLDNARSIDQVRPLLPTGPGSLVIVTSRAQLGELVTHEGALPILLDRLDDHDATRLLTTRLGRRSAAAPLEVMSRIAASCAGLPLALAMVGSRAVLDPELPLSRIADELVEPRSRLDALREGPNGSRGLRTVLDWSYRTLDEPARAFLRHLAAHPGGSVSVAAGASTAGVSHQVAGALTEQLVAASMLSRAGHGRYVLHDLVRAFAAELLDANPTERADAESRLVDHYVHSVRGAYLMFGRPPITDARPVLPGVHPESFSGSPFGAITWYQQERTVLLRLVTLAHDRGWFLEACLLALDARPMMHSVDAPADRLSAMMVPLDAAERLGEPALLAEVNRDIGGSYGVLSDRSQSDLHLHRALQSYRSSGDQLGESHVLRTLGTIAAAAGDVQAAVIYSLAAAEAAERSQDPSTISMSLVHYAEASISADAWSEALEAALGAVDVAHAHQLPYQEVLALASLTRVHHHFGRFPDVVTVGTRALSMMGEQSDAGLESVLTPRVAYAHLRIGDLHTARDLLERWRRVAGDHEGDQLTGRSDDLELQEAGEQVRELEAAVSAGASAVTDQSVDRN